MPEKIELLTGRDYWSTSECKRIDLRPLVMSDGPAGVRGTQWDERDSAFALPCATALAATWDGDLIGRLGELLGGEAVRKGVHVLLAPTINIQRSPYAGRHFEYFSEDPVLTGILAARLTVGIQSQGVAATLKHFVCNDSEEERFTVDVICPERTLREIYLLPFEIAVREGRPWAVMASYNAVNGRTMTESPLLTDVLKGEWGFDGVVLSDWRAARGVESAGAGLDLVMPGPGGPWGEDLQAAVDEGTISPTTIDDKVERLLLLAERTGNLGALGRNIPTPIAERPSARELLQTAARSSFVLVKNQDGLLPLARRSVRRLAVIGLPAEHPRIAGGGSATVFPGSLISPLDAILSAVGSECSVLQAPGPRVEERTPVLSASHLEDLNDTGHGLLVEFVDDSGHVVWTEKRAGGFLTWRDLPGEITPCQVRRVRATGTIVTSHSGEQTFGCSGTGRFWLRVGEADQIEAVLSTPAGTDPTEAYMRPPQLTTRFDALPGERIPFTVEYEPPKSTDTSFVLGGISLQVNFAGPSAPDSENLAEAEAIAGAADAAVIFVGTTEEVESEGFDRSDLRLPGAQDDLVERVLAANPRTVVVVNSGAPVLLPWIDRSPAVLLTPFPGQEYGPALAEVLFGDAEPSGRLPTTWPSSEEALPPTRPVDGVLRYAEGTRFGYRRAGTGSRYELFPFGHGLGYTTWDYSDMRLAEDSETGSVTATVTVANVGPRDGEEVVQVYARSVDPSDGLPDLRLVGFSKVWVPAKCSAVVPITVSRSQLSYWDEREHRWIPSRSPLQLLCGRSCRDLRLSAEVP